MIVLSAYLAMNLQNVTLRGLLLNRGVESSQSGAPSQIVGPGTTPEISERERRARQVQRYSGQEGLLVPAKE